jgi:hypothetical protein
VAGCIKSKTLDMGEILRLEIPRACGEDWGKMEKREEGRYCEHCQKTVVDFTGMTDEEVFNFFEKMGFFGICGRFLPGQMGRDLRPAPVQRNGWSGWKWLVASALMIIKPPEGGKPAKPVVTERTVRREPNQRETIVVSDGMIINTTSVKKARPRTVWPLSWKPTPLKAEAVNPIEIPVVATSATEAGYRPVFDIGENIFVGGISAGRRVDTTILAKIVSDTIASIASFFPKEEFVTLYPNPVGRGEALHLAWLSGEGKYQLTLVNMRGQVAEVRAIEVGGHGQVDSWFLPASLAAGVYVIRIEKAGGSHVDSREIMVR